MTIQKETVDQDEAFGIDALFSQNNLIENSEADCNPIQNRRRYTKSTGF